MITLKTIAPWNTGTEVLPGEMLGHRLSGLIDFLVDCRYSGVEFIELEEEAAEGTDTLWVTAYFSNQAMAEYMAHGNLEKISPKLWAVKGHF